MTIQIKDLSKIQKVKVNMALELNTVYQGDCLELMKNIADGSVDMILADLP